MSSSRRRFVMRQPVVVDIGCSCRRPKLSSFFSSSPPKLRLPKTPDPFSCSTATTISTNSLWDTSLTATTASSPLMSLPSLPPYSSAESPKQRPNKKTTKAKAKAKKKGVVEEGVAVVKESSDPYLDFRDSMLQMIVEMEIYTWDDLRDLLHRFLALTPLATTTLSSKPSPRSGPASSPPPPPPLSPQPLPPAPGRAAGDADRTSLPPAPPGACLGGARKENRGKSEVRSCHHLVPRGADLARG